jgi:hypothetical protein
MCPLLLATRAQFPVQMHVMCCNPLLATFAVVVFRFFSRWNQPLGEVPGKSAGGEPDRGLHFSAQTCRFAGNLYIGLAFWVTASVTLVVQSVLAGVFSANAHLLIADLPAPGNDDMVNIDGIVTRPEDPFINSKKPPLVDEGFDETYDMPDGKPCDGSETLIGNPGVSSVEVRFGEDGV